MSCYGRRRLKSHREVSMMASASVSEANWCMFNHSSLKRPLPTQ